MPIRITTVYDRPYRPLIRSWGGILFYASPVALSVALPNRAVTLHREEEPSGTTFNPDTGTAGILEAPVPITYNYTDPLTQMF
jgi:hypothetical protein